MTLSLGQTFLGLFQTAVGQDHGNGSLCVAAGNGDLLGSGLTLAAGGLHDDVLGGLAYAQEVGCHTVGISCNPGSAVGAAAELAIEVVPGPECLTGSTRLKSGPARS